MLNKKKLLVASTLFLTAFSLGTSTVSAQTDPYGHHPRFGQPETDYSKVNPCAIRGYVRIGYGAYSGGVAGAVGGVIATIMDCLP